MPRTCKRPATLSASLHHRLNSYALAATAAGVGALALAQPAEAKIVYTKTHEVIKRGSRLMLDLNHDGNTDFLFFVGTASHTLYSSDLDVARCFPGCSMNSIWTSNGPNLAAAFRLGVIVGRGRHLRTSAIMEGGGTNFQGTHSSIGNWLNVKNRYLGLKFRIKGKFHYGWARLNASYPPVLGVLTGYAYETIPNKPIVTGKTKGPDVITVQDGSLGALAAGAVSIHQ